MQSILRVRNLFLIASLSISIAIWMFALKRNLTVPYIGDSLGYVSRARNMAELGFMNHAPIEPFGVPLQSMGYALILSIVPRQLLIDAEGLRIFASIAQLLIYVLASWYFAKTVSRFAKYPADIVFGSLLIFWPAIIISTEVMSDSISLSLTLVILATLIRVMNTQSTLRMAIFLGLTYGTLLIVRPSSLIISPVIIFAFWKGNSNWKITKQKILHLILLTSLSSILISPQVIWTYQQFNKISLIELDDSYTQGIPLSVGEQNARATFIQLNGCAVPVDCPLINRYPGPLSWRSYQALGTDFPTWNEWLMVEPGFAILQSGMILMASLDQEFFYTYIRYPEAESNFFTLFLLWFFVLSGSKYLYSQLRSKDKETSRSAALVCSIIAPYLATQLFLFHAENRYGLVPATLLFFLGVLRFTSEDSKSKKVKDALFSSVFSLALSITIWKIFVLPFL